MCKAYANPILRDESGTSLVEFALIIGLLLLLMLGILDLGRAAYAYAALSNAARDGARYGIVQPAPGLPCQNATKAYVTSRVIGLDTSSAVFTPSVTCAGSSYVTNATVSINYKFHGVSGYIVALFGNQGYLLIHAQSSMDNH